MTSKQPLSVLGVLTFAALLGGTDVLSAQSRQDLAERLNNAAATTSLEGLPKPWHLKLAVTLLGKAGAAPQEGTVDVWRNGEEMRTVISLNGTVTTDFDHNGAHFHSAEGAPVPEFVQDLLDAVLHPGPQPFEVQGTEPELRVEKYGTALDCIMLSRPIHRPTGKITGETPTGLFPTYCFLPKSDHLQMTFSVGNLMVLRTGVGKFLDREVTTAVSLMNGTTAEARAKVIALSSFVPSEGEFMPPPEQVSGPRTVRISSGLVSGMKLKGDTPRYPESALKDRIGGSVVIHAIIDADGHVSHLMPVSVGDADLAIAALIAVRTWTYKPYLLNGEPTAIDTTITVNFNMSTSVQSLR